MPLLDVDTKMERLTLAESLDRRLCDDGIHPLRRRQNAGPESRRFLYACNPHNDLRDSTPRLMLRREATEYGNHEDDWNRGSHKGIDSVAQCGVPKGTTSEVHGKRDFFEKGVDQSVPFAAAAARYPIVVGYFVCRAATHHRSLRSL